MRLHLLPLHVRVCVALWFGCAGLLVALASVPAVRRPWQAAIAAERHGAFLISPPIPEFHTPYLSAVRFKPDVPIVQARGIALTIVSGAPDISTGAEGEKRALLAVELAPAASSWSWTSSRPVQFAASRSIRVLVQVPAEIQAGEIGLEYDGKSPVVAVITFWWPWFLAVIATGALLLLSPGTWELQRQFTGRSRTLWSSHRALLMLLVLAALLRAVLILRGGQYFDWDEHRYGVGATFLFDRLSTGNFHGALDLLLRSPDHPGFRVVGLVPAFFHVVSAYPTSQPISEMRHDSGEWLPALIFSLTSVCSIGLTYFLARRAGASDEEGFLAAFLMFCSAAMAVHTRHFFPYDTALMLLLTALWLGLSDGSRLRSLLVGLICGLGWLTYEGYWLLAALVGAVHLSRQTGSLWKRASRLALFGVGLALLPALLVVAGLLEGRPFLRELLRFSQTVTNGNFSEGWSLPWAYQWHLEHGVMLVLLSGLAMTLVQRSARNTGQLWAVLALVAYAGLVVGSNALHRFVVYDRLAREIFPFICLAAAPGLASLRFRRALYVALLCLFGWNYWGMASLHFPREIVKAAIARYGADHVGLATTVPHAIDSTGPLFLPPEVQPQGGEPVRRYVVVNPRDIWIEGAAESSVPPAGTVIESFTHPRQVPAMQYHGYTPAIRKFLRANDVGIKVIDTGR